jgi:tetratricopeptide (TPR) repeat protein
MKGILTMLMFLGMGMSAFLYAGEQYVNPGKETPPKSDGGDSFQDDSYVVEENMIQPGEVYDEEVSGESQYAWNDWNPVAGSKDGKYVALKLKKEGQAEQIVFINVWNKKTVKPVSDGGSMAYSLDSGYYTTELHPVKYADFYIDFKLSTTKECYSYGTDILSFYIVNPATGYKWKVQDKASPVAKTPYPYAAGNTVSKMYLSHDADYYVVMYSVGANEKYGESGTDGYLIVNSYDLSRFYNGIGYRYYKLKQYKNALNAFLTALTFDKKYVLALYNTACMYALMKDSSKSVEYLWEIRQLGTKEAWEKLQKMKKDADFNAIRKTAVYKKFIAAVW